MSEVKKATRDGFGEEIVELGQMDFLAQSSKVLPQSSPKHGPVVTGIPHYAGTNLS